MKKTRIKSLREYLDKLEEMSDLVRVTKEVDWNLEMGAIARRCYDNRAPAPLFENVKGSPGYRTLGTPCSLSSLPDMPTSRIAISLGLAPDTNPNDIVKELAKTNDVEPIPPKEVTEGACKEVILKGDEIDLTKFPVPIIHNKDGGRYLNTWGIVIAKSPDSKWVNWSIARIMIDGPRKMTGMLAPGQHIGELFLEWKALGKDMPFAVVQGAEPCVPLGGCMAIPDGQSEAEFLGGWFGEAIEVIKCETNDLLVPASAEIVLEGTVSATETTSEGPFGEYAGYIWLGETKDAPVYNVDVVTHRKNPILPFICAGVPVEEDHAPWGLAISSQIYKHLLNKGFPVKRVYAPFETAHHWVVITVDDHYKSYAETEPLIAQLKDILQEGGHKNLFYVPKFFVMSDKIDPSNTREVLWAVATRLHPVEGLTLVENVRMMTLNGHLTPEEKITGEGTKAIFNCLGPYNAGNLVAEATQFEHWPEEIQQKVLDNWESYGLGDYNTKR